MMISYYSSYPLYSLAPRIAQQAIICNVIRSFSLFVEHWTLNTEHQSNSSYCLYVYSGFKWYEESFKVSFSFWDGIENIFDRSPYHSDVADRLVGGRDVFLWLESLLSVVAWHLHWCSGSQYLGHSQQVYTTQSSLLSLITCKISSQ